MKRIPTDFSGRGARTFCRHHDHALSPEFVLLSVEIPFIREIRVLLPITSNFSPCLSRYCHRELCRWGHQEFPENPIHALHMSLAYNFAASSWSLPGCPPVLLISSEICCSVNVTPEFFKRCRRKFRVTCGAKGVTSIFTQILAKRLSGKYHS